MPEYTIIRDGVPHAFVSLEKAAKFLMQSIIDDCHYELYTLNPEIKAHAVCMLID